MEENTERKSETGQTEFKTGTSTAGIVKTLVMMDKAVSLLPERAVDIQLFEFYVAVMLRRYLQMLEHKVTEEEREKYAAPFKADMRQMTDMYLKAMDGRPVLTETVADLPKIQAENGLLVSAYLQIIEKNIDNKLLEPEMPDEDGQDIATHVVTAALMSAADADKENVHKGGRPPVNLPAEFYRAILAEYDNQLTIGQIAGEHKVSRSTVNRWLRRARENVKKLEEAAGHSETRNLPKSGPED